MLKIALQYIFNVDILSTVLSLKLSFKLKLDKKCLLLKTWKKFKKKKLEEISQKNLATLLSYK